MSWFTPLLSPSKPLTNAGHARKIAHLTKPMDYDELMRQIGDKPFTRAEATAIWEVKSNVAGSRIYLMKKRGLVKQSILKNHWEKVNAAPI